MCQQLREQMVNHSLRRNFLFAGLEVLICDQPARRLVPFQKISGQAFRPFRQDSVWIRTRDPGESVPLLFAFSNEYDPALRTL